MPRSVTRRLCASPLVLAVPLTVVVALLGGPGSAGLPIPVVASASAAPAETGSIGGRIIDELGRPLSGVRVRVDRVVKISEMGSEQRPAGEAISDADGRYVVADLPPATTYLLWYDKADYEYGPAWEGTSNVTVAAGATTTRDVFLIERSATVRGRVLDVRGTPIVGAQTPFGLTDAGGRYEARVIPGDHPIGATAAGYRPIHALTLWDRGVRVVSADRGRTTEAPDLVLRRAPTAPCWTETGEWLTNGENGRPFDPPSTGQLRPREEHLCPDVDAAELPPDTAAPPVRVGVPAPPAPATRPLAGTSTPPPAATTPKPVRSPVAGALRVPGRTTVTSGRFLVRSSCTARCAGRIVATAGPGRRVTVVGVAAVASGSGARRHRVVLRRAGRRLLARSPRGLVVRLRWDAPGAAVDRGGPRVRLVAGR
jgi:hypothetical protein